MTSLDRVLADARGLLLDVDDTLVDTRAAMLAAGSAAAAVLWPELDPSVRLGFAARYYDDPGRFFGEYAAGRLPFAAMRSARLAEATAAFGLGLDEVTYARFEDAYLPAFADGIAFLPGAEDLLEAAWATGLPVGLLTNSSGAATQTKLDRLGFTGPLACVVTADTLGFGKPDPRVYAHACDLLGTSPERTVAIGDNLAWDVVGPLDAGLRAVWLDVAGAGSGDERAGRVRSLSEVASALRVAHPTDLGRRGAPR